MTEGSTQWVLLSYFLPIVAMTLPAGRWVDRASLRWAFLLAVAGFAVASALVSVAPGAVFLFVARVLQGAFSGIIAALVFPVLAAVVRPDQRGRAFGALATLGPIGSIAGPGLGGLIAAHLGWRGIFLINVPVCAVALWLGARSMPRDDGGLPVPDRRQLRETLSLGMTLTGLLIALELGSWIFALLGVAALVLWVQSPESRVVLRIVGSRLGPPLGALLLFVITGGGAINFLLPFLIQEVQGRTPDVAGATMLALPLGIGIMAPVAGWLADRMDTRRLPLLGTVFGVAGTLLLIPLDGTAAQLDIAWRIALIGIGLGLFVSPIQTLLLSSARPDQTALVGAVAQLTLMLGFTLGPVIGAASLRLASDGALMDGIRIGFIASAVLTAIALVGALAVWIAFRARPTPVQEPAVEAQA